MDSNGNFTSGKYIGHTKANWPCVSSCPAGTKINGKNCERECPLGYSDLLNVCTKCATGTYSYGTSCVSSCPAGTYTYKTGCFTSCPQFTEPENDICVAWCRKDYSFEPNMVFTTPISHLYTTFTFCPGDYVCSYFNMVYKTGGLKNVCITCDTQYSSVQPYLKYYNEVTRSCVRETNCPALTAPSKTNKACIKCTNIENYKKLDHLYKIVIDFNHCLYCDTQNKFMLNKDGNCLATCPNYYTFDSENNCEYCANYTKDNLCISKCPDYLGYDSYRRCAKCQSISPYLKYYKGECKIDIPTTTTLINLEYYVFVDCIDAGKKVYSGSCVDTCPSGTITNTGGNECFDIVTVSTVSVSKFTNDGIVVDECPASYYYNSKNECIKCSTYINNNECVQQCPTNYLYDSYKNCYNCESINKIYFNSECVDTCPSYTYFYKQDNKCIYCKNYNQYFIEGTSECIDKCPYNKLAYDINNLCYDNCKESNYVILFGKCQEKCPNGTKYNKDTNECEEGFKSIRNYFNKF